MTNAASIFRAAHAATRAIVAETGGSYRTQFALCLKAEYATPATPADKIEVVKALAAVASVNVWQERRAYINLVGFDRSFAGDRNYKLYIDLASGELVEQRGKGITNRNLDASAEAVITALAA